MPIHISYESDKQTAHKRAEILHLASLLYMQFAVQVDTVEALSFSRIAGDVNLLSCVHLESRLLFVAVGSSLVKFAWWRRKRAPKEADDYQWALSVFFPSLSLDFARSTSGGPAKRRATTSHVKFSQQSQTKYSKVSCVGLHLHAIHFHLNYQETPARQETGQLGNGKVCEKPV